MQVSDTIEVVQGSLGSGKSMVAVMECIYQLRAGGVIATNFDLSPLWAWMLSSQDVKVHLRMKNRYKLACSFMIEPFKIGNPDSMVKLSGDEGLNLAAMCTGKLKKQIENDSRGHRIEGKGLLVLDDCHHFFNSRTFTGNKQYVEFFANARKWGWRTILITHDIANIDKQVRSYVYLESRFRNLRQMRLPILGLPLSPIPAFIVQRRYSGLGPGSGLMHSKDFFFMDRGAADLYNTLERFTADKVLGAYEKQGLNPRDYAIDGANNLLDFQTVDQAPVKDRKPKLSTIPYHCRIDPGYCSSVL